MKITIVLGAFLPVPTLMGGAVEKVWFALGKEFARRGHEVVQISRQCCGLPAEEVIDGVRHLRVPGFDTPPSMLQLKACDLLYSLRARRILPEADILITNTFWLPMLVRTKRYGKLYVHVARYPKGQMRLYSHADRLQTVSRPIMEAIVKEVPQLENKICYIQLPLPDGIPPLSSAKREKQILYVGRVHPEKGIGLLIDAVARIPEELFAGWKLVVVGPAESKFGGGGDAYLEDLKRRAEKISDRIVWTGAIFDVAQLDAHYRAASLFVYPSLAEKGETFGLAPLEAMAQGCPAIVSNLRCFQEFIQPGESGFVFDHRSADPAQVLAAQIQELIGNPERLAQTSVKAHRRANDFSLERVAGQYLDDFQTLIS